MSSMGSLRVMSEGAACTGLRDRVAGIRVLSAAGAMLVNRRAGEPAALSRPASAARSPSHGDPRYRDSVVHRQFRNVRSTTSSARSNSPARPQQQQPRSPPGLARAAGASGTVLRGERPLASSGMTAFQVAGRHARRRANTMLPSGWRRTRPATTGHRTSRSTSARISGSRRFAPGSPSRVYSLHHRVGWVDLQKLSVTFRLRRKWIYAERSVAIRRQELLRPAAGRPALPPWRSQFLHPFAARLTRARSWPGRPSRRSGPSAAGTGAEPLRPCRGPPAHRLSRTAQ